MALCESVVRTIEEQAAEHAFKKVKTVWLEIGQLSTAEPDSMEFCFPIVAKGTLVEGAKLEIIRTPGEAWCLDCNLPVPVAARFDPCPKCNGHSLHLRQGDELRIKELEVE
jgi:hydrogenase nickel incorporation protein HypA/HybF